MPKVTKKQRVRDFAAERGWSSIGEPEWRELRTAMLDVSESTLRDCGLAIEMPWRGIVTHSLDELEASLCEMSRIYDSRPELQRYCRDQVIGAKDRARWIAKSSKVDEEKRRLKLEMTKWMLVWLDDPAMFPTWVRLRREEMG